MARMLVWVEVSPALADLANLEAWPAKLHWREWIQQWVQAQVDKAVLARVSGKGKEAGR